MESGASVGKWSGCRGSPARGTSRKDDSKAVERACSGVRCVAGDSSVAGTYEYSPAMACGKSVGAEDDVVVAVGASGASDGGYTDHPSLPVAITAH